MKKQILLIPGILFCGLFSYSQTYTQLLTDPQGDNINFVPDLGTISYAMDMAHDSIWFKIQTYNAITDSNDLGLEIGIDTDLNINNGFLWDGSNHSMKCDEILFVTQDLVQPGFRYCALGQAGSPASFNAHVSHPDNYTWIINAQLSLLDNDGRFNVIFGGAFFDCSSTPSSVYDNAPDAGYKTIGVANGVLSFNEGPGISIYPNPVTDLLLIDTKVPMEAKIVNCTGVVVSSISAVQGRNELSMQAMPAGIYFFIADHYRYKIVKL